MPTIKTKFDTLNQFNWHEKVTTYDESGAISTALVINDNGTQSETYYVGGAVQQLLLVDGEGANSTGDWQQTNKTFDPVTGLMISKQTIYDDGTQKLDIFLNGQLSQTRMSDSANAESWDSVITLYDTAGQISTRETINDDGTIKTQGYVGGNLIETIETDSAVDGGAEAWSIRSTTYASNGSVTGSHMVYDNADEFVFHYAEGKKDVKIEYDGDDSHGWLLKITDYDASGAVTGVSTYNDAADVPAQYAEQLTQIDGLDFQPVIHIMPERELPMLEPIELIPLYEPELIPLLQDDSNWF